jgi:hypothetical protein
MGEFLRLRSRDIEGGLDMGHHSGRPRPTTVRIRLRLAGAVLAGLLAVLPWSAREPGWLGAHARAAASSPGLSLLPSSWPTYPGATFQVDIVADCGSNADAAATVVAFDPAHLQVEALTPDASVFATTLLQAYDNVAGQVQYDAGSLTCHSASSCPSGSVRLGTIRFRAVGECGFSVPLSIQGQITWEGAFIFNGVGSGNTVGISIAGDVDLDGDVDVVDIMLVAGRWSSVQGQPQYDARYDLDADGDIDVADIMFVASRWNQTCAGGGALVEEAH